MRQQNDIGGTGCEILRYRLWNLTLQVVGSYVTGCGILRYRLWDLTSQVVESYVTGYENLRYRLWDIYVTGCGILRHRLLSRSALRVRRQCIPAHPAETSCDKVIIVTL
jgi:hypothetical protein